MGIKAERLTAPAARIEKGRTRRAWFKFARTPEWLRRCRLGTPRSIVVGRRTGARC
jgi:hypothetical protein